MTNYYGTYSASECPGIKAALDINGTTIYGGPVNAAEDNYNFDLIIRIGDTPKTFSPSVTANEEAQGVLPENILKPKMPPIISLTWPDYYIPPLDATWWKSLYNYIKAMPSGTKVLVYCVGGRGRTGTFLSILAGLVIKEMGGSMDPVKYIRQQYCKTAVESVYQIEYITAMTGIRVKELSAFRLEQIQKENAKKLESLKAKKHKKRKKGGAVVVSKKKSLGEIEDTDIVELDEETGEVYVNGELYEGDDIGFTTAKDGSIQYGELKSNTATPDYTGPAHRQSV